MILPNYNNTSFLENAINNSFLLYREDAIKLLKKSWNEEDLNETSNEQFRAAQYSFAIQLVILIYLDYTRFPSLGWAYYVAKFELEKFSKCLKCYNINLDKILEKFSLPSVLGGIEFQEIEETFIIEEDGDNEEIQTVDIKEFISLEESCTVYIEDNCKQ